LDLSCPERLSDYSWAVLPLALPRTVNGLAHYILDKVEPFYDNDFGHLIRF